MKTSLAAALALLLSGNGPAFAHGSDIGVTSAGGATCRGPAFTLDFSTDYCSEAASGPTCLRTSVTFDGRRFLVPFGLSPESAAAPAASVWIERLDGPGTFVPAVLAQIGADMATTRWKSATGAAESAQIVLTPEGDRVYAAFVIGGEAHAGWLACTGGLRPAP